MTCTLSSIHKFVWKWKRNTVGAVAIATDRKKGGNERDWNLFDTLGWRLTRADLVWRSRKSSTRCSPGIEIYRQVIVLRFSFEEKPLYTCMYFQIKNIVQIHLNCLANILSWILSIYKVDKLLSFGYLQQYRYLQEPNQPLLWERSWYIWWRLDEIAIIWHINDYLKRMEHTTQDAIARCWLLPGPVQRIKSCYSSTIAAVWLEPHSVFTTHRKITNIEHLKVARLIN